MGLASPRQLATSDAAKVLQGTKMSARQKLNGNCKSQASTEATIVMTHRCRSVMEALQWAEMGAKQKLKR